MLPGVQVLSVLMLVVIELAHQPVSSSEYLHIHFLSLEGRVPLELDLAVRFGFGGNREPNDTWCRCHRWGRGSCRRKGLGRKGACYGGRVGMGHGRRIGLGRQSARGRRSGGLGGRGRGDRKGMGSCKSTGGGRGKSIRWQSTGHGGRISFCYRKGLCDRKSFSDRKCPRKGGGIGIGREGSRCRTSKGIRRCMSRGV